MKRHDGLTRWMGKIFLASGFFLSIYGLSRSSPFWINLSLALLATGIVATAMGFYKGLRSLGSDRGPYGIKKGDGRE